MFKMVVLLCAISTLFSCSNQDDSLVAGGDDVNLSFSMTCFGSVEVGSTDQVRYILEMYKASEVDAWRQDNSKPLSAVKRVAFSGNNFFDPQSYDFRIMAGDYYLLAWADNGATYYDANSLINIISLKRSLPNDSKKEAFGYMSTDVLTINADMTLPQVTLRRRVGRVTVQTNDISHLYADPQEGAEFDPAKSHIDIEYLSLTYDKYYSVLNLIDHTLTAESNSRTVEVLIGDIGDEYYTTPIRALIYDYVFLPQKNNAGWNEGKVTFTAKLSTGSASGDDDPSFMRDNLELTNNSYTTFTGNTLTVGAVIEADVDNDWN